MHLPNPFTLVMLFIALAHVTTAVDFGIGIILALDYGTVSVYYPNGSSANIAKVEGGAEYKAMMRAQPWHFDPVKRWEEEKQNEVPIPRPRSAFASKLSSKFESIRIQLPPWLGGPVYGPEIKPLSRTLLALKTAAESFTESKISIIQVTFPGYAPQALLKSVESAAKVLGLKLPGRPAVGPAAVFATGAHNIESECYAEETDDWVLALDFSRAALAIVSMVEDCSMSFVTRAIFNSSLGAASWSEEAQMSIVSTLKDFLEDPRGDGSIGRVIALVLLGESAAEDRF